MRVTLSNLPPRIRAYLLVLVLGVGYFVGSRLWELCQPPAVWLTRGLEAMHLGLYDESARCARVARWKAPGSDLVDVAEHVRLWHFSHDDPLAMTRFYYLGSLAKTLGWTTLRERAWRAANEVRAADQLHAMRWPAGSALTLGAAATIYDEYWLEQSQAAQQVLAAIQAIRQSRGADAYTAFHHLAQQRNGHLLAMMREKEPLLWRNEALAAWQSGHPADARRLLARYRALPPFWHRTYDDFIPDSIRRIDPAADKGDDLAPLLHH